MLHLSRDSFFHAAEVEEAQAFSVHVVIVEHSSRVEANGALSVRWSLRTTAVRF